MSLSGEPLGPEPSISQGQYPPCQAEKYHLPCTEPTRSSPGTMTLASAMLMVLKRGGPTMYPVNPSVKRGVKNSDADQW